MAKAPGSCASLEVLPIGHPERPSLERLISDTYQHTYGAHIQHFAQNLVGLRRRDRSWSAGMGYTLAGNDALFLEQYLDRPAEAEITARMRLPVPREQLVEVGNLAAFGTASPCTARYLIISMARLLQGLGRPWVVFTSTQSLRNSFARLGVDPIVLAHADPRRLPDQGLSWGTYYDNYPQVMTANIHLGLAQLSATTPGQPT